MSDVVIFGAGEMAEVVHYYLSNDSNHRVVAFCVDDQYLDSTTLLGCPVIAKSELAQTFPTGKYSVFAAISYKKMNTHRQKIVGELKSMGYDLISYVHSRTEVWNGFSAKPNTFIMENNTIQPYVTIGENNLIWSGNHIGHHTSIANHCFIASHTVISGSVTIGSNCFIGVNATIRDNVNIADQTLIGAGALVLSNTKEREVYAGVRSEPLRITSDRIRNI